MPVLDRARSVVRLSGLVRERPRFIARQAARRPTVGRYRLAGSPVAFHLRHATDDVATLDQVVGRRHYQLPAPVRYALRGAGRPLEIVDLGANIGLFGAEALTRWPDAHVVAFEPDPANAAVLRRTIAANAGRRWELVAACAGVEDGEVAFAAGQFANSRIADDGATDTETVRVPVRDVFPWLERADFVKIDIEGAEWPLLADPRFGSLPARAIALEFHHYGCPGDPQALAAQALRDAGFEVGEGHLDATPGCGMVWGWKRR
jgi:FkbM family methyltransferase